MGTKHDSERSGGLDEVFAAADKVTAAAGHISRKSAGFGPLGGRRLGRHLGVSIGLFLALFFVARMLLELDTLSTTSRVLISMLPLPVFGWFLWSFVQSVSLADELERRIQLEALAVAFPLTILLIMTLGLLQIAVPLSPDDWSYRHIWPFMYVFYLAGLTWARRRYV
jgi:hypothetical protein